jgi:hypothetical protein
MKYTCAFLVVCCWLSAASAQTSWWRTYGGTDSDVGFSVQQTSDGGYIIVGYTRSFGLGHDVYLIKTNASGDTLWTRTYGGTNTDEGHSVQQTSDGGYIIVGRTGSFGAGGWDVYLIKTDGSGGTLWTRTYGGTNHDEGNSVRQTSDSGYVIAGITKSFGVGSYDVYLIKTNASGDTLWTRTFGGADDDDGGSVQQTSDGGYIIAGRTAGSFGSVSYDVYLIKTNALGETLWTRTYGGPNSDWSYSVQQTSDGGYIIAGATFSYGAGPYDVYLIKTDANGNVGVAEGSSKLRAIGPGSATTGTRSLPTSAVTFDAMGRRATHARAGVFFVRDEGRGAGDVGRMRKVVVQR